MPELHRCTTLGQYEAQLKEMVPPHRYDLARGYKTLEPQSLEAKCLRRSMFFTRSSSECPKEKRKDPWNVGQLSPFCEKGEALASWLLDIRLTVRRTADR